MADIKAERGIVRSVWLKSEYKWFDKNEEVVKLVGGGGRERSFDANSYN